MYWQCFFRSCPLIPLSGWIMKLMLIGAQGVYFNGLFLSYLISPKITHRFGKQYPLSSHLIPFYPHLDNKSLTFSPLTVGYLEEEAVHTYTLAIKQIEEGHLPKWADPEFKVPDIAVQYWHMPEGKRTMKDLILYIRADGESILYPCQHERR